MRSSTHLLIGAVISGVLLFNSSGCASRQPAFENASSASLAAAGATISLKLETVRVGDAIAATTFITNAGNAPVELAGLFAFQSDYALADRPQWLALYSETLLITVPPNDSISLQHSIVLTDVLYPYEVFRAFISVSNEITATATANFDVLPAFDIAVEHPNSVQWDETFNVVITITNQVTFTIENVQLALKLPVTFIADPLTVDLGHLAVGESRVCAWQISPLTNQPSPSEEIRVLVSTANGGQAESRIIQAMQRPPELVVRADPAFFDIPWQTMTPISFTVRNVGDLALAGVTIVLTTPAGVTPTTSYWDVGSLAGNQKVVLETSLETNLLHDFFVELVANAASGSSDHSAIRFHVLSE